MKRLIHVLKSTCPLTWRVPNFNDFRYWPIRISIRQVRITLEDFLWNKINKFTVLLLSKDTWDHSFIQAVSSYVLSCRLASKETTVKSKSSVNNWFHILLLSRKYFVPEPYYSLFDKRWNLEEPRGMWRSSRRLCNIDIFTDDSISFCTNKPIRLEGRVTTWDQTRVPASPFLGN